MKIRELREEDINTIMNIWLKSTIKGHSFIDKEYWNKNYDVVKNIYIPMAETFVYEEGKNIGGFISVINKEFIGALFVDIDKQGNGVGSKLIEYAKEKYGKLNLSVYKDNKNAIKFYKKHEFKVIKEKENEDSGFIEYIMEN